MSRRLRASPGVTLIEVAVVALIVAILALLGARSWGIKGEREHNARLKLTEVWSAEKRFYAFKGRYTDSWVELAIEEPRAYTPADYAYFLALTESGDNFSGTAVPGNGGAALRVDRTGTVSAGGT